MRGLGRGAGAFEVRGRDQRLLKQIALSAQLLVTELNVILGKVDVSRSVLVPAVTIPDTNLSLSSTLQNSLKTNGVTDANGVATVQDLLNASIAELLAAPNTKAANIAAMDTMLMR